MSEKKEKKAAEAGETAEMPEVAEKIAADGETTAGQPPEAEKKDAAEKPAEKPSEPDWKSLYAITLADFDNYKKRAARDREDVYRYAESDILKDILPTVDNLGLALEKAADAEDPFVQGVKLVYDGLLKALADHGAKPMDGIVGREPDPNLHESIATLPDAKIGEGRICKVVKTGWTLNDKLLRAAQVVVSAGAPAREAGGKNEEEAHGAQ
ncbi:MAG: nucleotide exchange factor GrpE [Kiritimatiellae bacterium]|nr:nucleotide exchange factor GrpE [Kiritimatiellia bacterium]